MAKKMYLKDKTFQLEEDAINVLYGETMKPFYRQSKHPQFLDNKTFEDNKYKIYILSAAKNRLLKMTLIVK